MSKNEVQSRPLYAVEMDERIRLGKICHKSRPNPKNNATIKMKLTPKPPHLMPHFLTFLEARLDPTLILSPYL